MSSVAPGASKHPRIMMSGRACYFPKTGTRINERAESSRSGGPQEPRIHLANDPIRDQDKETWGGGDTSPISTLK